jgi:hypothetical protein
MSTNKLVSLFKITVCVFLMAVSCQVSAGYYVQESDYYVGCQNCNWGPASRCATHRYYRHYRPRHHCYTRHHYTRRSCSSCSRANVSVYYVESMYPAYPCRTCGSPCRTSNCQYTYHYERPSCVRCRRGNPYGDTGMSYDTSTADDMGDY